MKRLLRLLMLVVAFLTSGYGINAQTTLLDPTGAGGFESGATFTDNGWTVVNGTVVNQWFVGTVPTGFTNNSAYVSNNSGAANAYTNTSTSVSHFYRDVTFPAGQTVISLSFNWMALGEASFFDGLLVSIAPTTYNPAASTTSLGTAALAAPAVEVGRFWNTSTPQLATVSIPASVAGNCTANSTVRLIFTWKNDNSGGSNPAAVVDNISLVSSVPNITSLGGTFTINNTLPTGGTNYQSFTAAINDLNAGAACGLTGPVVFNVSAGQTFNETPPVITASGTSTATITFQKSGTGNNPVITPTGTAGNNDGGIVISGGDYFTFDGIDINSSNSATVEYGYILRNITATDGAQFNIIKNCSITMTRAINTATGTSAAIIQSASTTAGGVAPTSAAGANSNNKYYNLTISNALNGVYLNGNGTNRDLNTEVGTTGGCSVRNTFTNLGPTVATFTSARGVYATGQENFKIFNSDFTSIAGNQGTTAGIYTTNIFGNANNVYGNKVSNVSVFGSTTTTSVAYGIYTDMNATGTNITNIYNNSISNIFSSFSGTATTSVYSVGLYCGTASSTGAYNVDNNSVSIGAGLTPTYSIAVLRNNGSTCAYNVRNNVFANYTNAQTTARHMIWWTSSATSIGASSIVSNNDLYIANDLGVSGFTAVTNTTTRTTIADFDLAITTPTAAIEANSVTLNPTFLSNLNDLHVTNVNLNNLGTTLQSYVTVDLDCATRNDSDMGAYVINACSGSPNPTEALATTATSVCPNNSVSISASGLSTEAGIVHQWQVSTVSGGPYTNVSSGTGANSANYNTGNLVSPGTYYYILSSTCSASGLTAVSNEVSVTVFAPPTITITPSNGGNFCGQGTLTASGALTYTWSPALFLESTTGSTVTSTTTTNSTFSVIGVDANGCSNNASVNITYTAPPAVAITATNPSFCGTGGVSTLTANSATAYNYTWQALDGATLSTTTGNTTDATVTQTSSFKLTAIEAATSCVNVQYYSIGVYPLPTATVTTTANGVCPGTSATINSGLSAGNFTVSSVPYVAKNAPITATTIATNGQALVPLSGGSLDDGGWSNIPIGFSFNFFGNSFSSISAGTNGLLMFGTPPGYGTGAGQLGQFNFNTTGGVFPNANNPGNVIALMAADQYFGNLSQTAGGASSTIKYWTEGYAPNRIFVIEYSDVDPCCSNGPTGFTAQARLYETIGVVDIAVVSKTATNSPTIGLQDATKTIGAVAPGRQAFSSLITTPETWRFSPPSNYTTTWFADGTQFDTGTNIFSESVSPAVTTTYSITYTNQTTGCTNAPGSAQVTMSVLGQVAPSNVTAQATVGTACSGVTFNLSTNYTGPTDGLTYQWQVSTDNGTTWNNITGANGLTYTTSLTTASSYRIGISSCGGTVEYSTPVSVALSAPTDCYCTPTYTSGTSSGDLISNVEIVGTTLINNTGTTQGGPSYTFYTGQPNYTATLLPSSSYSVNVTVGTWGNQHIRAWIDYNDDGIFSSSESIGSAVIAPGQSNNGPFPPASFTVSLACTPPAGVHRLRIRSVWSTTANFNTTINPCSNEGYGETEDYLITIAPAPTCPAPGLMTAGTTTSTTAPLSWNMGCSVATNFDFEYGPVGFTQGTGTAVNNQVVTVSGTTGTFTLTGLTPNTQYSVYYRANCGNGDVSPWSVATNFTTLCAPISLNNPGNAVACDSYTLPTLTEFTPSNNTGLTLSYYNGPNGTGGQITGPITTTKTVYARGKAGSCATDSVFTVTIYNTPTLTVLNPTICLGDSTVLWSTQGNAIDFVYTLNNNFIGSGVAYHVTPSATTTYGISAVGLGGCISAEQQATVTVNQPTTSTSTATSCDSYTWNGQTYSQSGTYTFTTTNAAGCDSVATLNLTINNSTTGSETITACDSLVWNGQTYTQSGTYTYLTTNAVGCDSTVTLNLTINNSTTSSTNVTACVSYQWNGQTYTQSGVYTFTTTNAVGCDSVATLNLTINNALFTTETVSACVTYDWNGQTYSQSGTYTFLTTSVNGCDSTVTLNLTINQPSSSTTTQTACDSYTWNGQTYNQSGTYVFNTTTVAGCDSTATLELTINNSTTSSTSQTACDSYAWNGQTYTQSGTYTYTTTNAVGCDSVATLLLTINNSTTSSTTQAACDSYTWNGQTYTQSGSYTYTTTNAAGCDSTATLILTINQSPSATATDNGDGTGTASAGATYQWIDCATNTAIAGATQQTFAPSVTGQYSVVLTNASGCSDTSICITINVSKLNELSSLNVQVNPNPSNGVFNLTMNTSVNGQIVVTDATGRIIATQSMSGTSSTIDLTNTVTGIYYFTVQFNDSEKVIRVIKN